MGFLSDIYDNHAKTGLMRLHSILKLIWYANGALGALGRATLTQ